MRAKFLSGMLSPRALWGIRKGGEEGGWAVNQNRASIWTHTHTHNAERDRWTVRWTHTHTHIDMHTHTHTYSCTHTHRAISEM